MVRLNDLGLELRGVNERRRQAFFPMPSVIGHPSGDNPLVMDVRLGGSGPHETGPRGDAWHLDPRAPYSIERPGTYWYLHLHR
jgi:hypothetical protein